MSCFFVVPSIIFDPSFNYSWGQSSLLNIRQTFDNIYNTLTPFKNAPSVKGFLAFACSFQNMLLILHIWYEFLIPTAFRGFYKKNLHSFYWTYNSFVHFICAHKWLSKKFERVCSIFCNILKSQLSKVFFNIQCICFRVKLFFLSYF